MSYEEYFEFLLKFMAQLKFIAKYNITIRCDIDTLQGRFTHE